MRGLQSIHSINGIKTFNMKSLFWIDIAFDPSYFEFVCCLLQKLSSKKRRKYHKSHSEKVWWVMRGHRTYHPHMEWQTVLICFLSPHRILCCWQRCIKFGWHPVQTDWQAPGWTPWRNPQNPPVHLKMSWHTPHLLPFPRVNVFLFLLRPPLVLHFRCLIKSKTKILKSKTQEECSAFFFQSNILCSLKLRLFLTIQYKNFNCFPCLTDRRESLRLTQRRTDGAPSPSWLVRLDVGATLRGCFREAEIQIKI